MDHTLGTWGLWQPYGPYGNKSCLMTDDSAMILAATKIIGTAATGIWAAYSVAICNNYSAVPGIATILGVDTADLKTIIDRSTNLSILSGVSSIALILSYVLSPRNGKHPYLLYGALGAPLIGLLQYSGAQDLAAQLPEDEKSELTGSVYEKIGESELPLTNKAKLYTRAVAILSSSLYLLGLVGLAGDSL